MATLTLTATGLTQRSKTISAADTTRMLNAYRVLYGKVSDGAGGMRDRTNQEIFDLLADALFSYMRSTVKEVERGVAAQAVVDVSLT